MNFKTYLEEGRDAPLYHYTNLKAAESIIKNDIIMALTKQKLDILNKPLSQMPHTKGVSLTRDKYDIGYDSIKFELDQKKLAQRYKIVPFDWFHRGNKAWSKKIKLKKLEKEEFVIGDIKNLHEYIIKIHLLINKSNLTKYPTLNNHTKLFYKGKFINV